MPVDEEINKKMSRKRIRGEDENMETQNHTNGSELIVRESSPTIDAVSYFILIGKF